MISLHVDISEGVNEKVHNNYKLSSSICVKMAPLSSLSFATVMINIDIEFLACSTQKQRETLRPRREALALLSGVILYVARS